jgi:LAO/AO transport system kinase
MPATKGWNTKAMTCSALTKKGVLEIWNNIQAFKNDTTKSGAFGARRSTQLGQWMEALILERLESEFYKNEHIQAEREKTKRQVIDGSLPAPAAADRLFDIYINGKNNDHS